MKYFTPYRPPVRPKKSPRLGRRFPSAGMGFLVRSATGPFLSVFAAGVWLILAAFVIYFLRGVATGDWSLPTLR